MASIVSTIEIGRTPEEVFPYVTDPSRFGEWQKGVMSGSEEGHGVGAKCTMTRKIGGAERTSTSAVTEYDPPRRWAIHGIDGPIRADVSVLVEPVSGDSGQRSRVTLQLDFHGHGFGKVIAPFVTSQARKEVPISCQKLKERLEQGS
jgi:carbon monoxide dehydrogenase subunit G